MGMILRIASSRIVGQGDIVGRSGYFSLNLSANSVMRGRLDARRTLKSLVADLRFSSCFVLIHNRFGVSPLTDGIPLFFENGINTGIFIFGGAVRIVYECHKLFETSFAAHTKTFA